MILRLPNSSFVQVGGRQERFFCRLGWKADDRDGSQHAVDPGDEAQPPRGGIQADDARADVIETHRPFQKGTSKRGIMDVGRREEKKERQARAATEQGVHPIAAQKWTGMLSGSMTKSRIRVGAMPSQNGSTLDDE